MRSRTGLRNIIIAIALCAIVVIPMIFAQKRSYLLRQLQGPIEGTDSVMTVDGRLSVVSKNNYIYTWQWHDLKIWPIVAKPQASVIAPIAGDKVIYNASAGGKLIVTNLTADKEITFLSLPYGAECKKIKTSSNGKFGVVSMLLKESVQKDWLKLAVFDTDLKSLSFVFQKDVKVENFVLHDFTITDDGKMLACAGKKGKAWVFVTDIKNEKILWEKTFDEYDQFTNLAFSPDGKTLYVAEKVRYIIALDSATGNTIKVYEMPIYDTPANQKQNISCVAVSPDGKVLAVDTEPARTVWFWDLASGKKTGEILASELTVSDIAFSPDSKYLATGCLVSPEIKIWKVPQPK